MSKNDWYLTTWLVISYFIFLELTSWLPAGPFPCIVNNPYEQSAYNNDQPKYCPAFHVGLEIIIAKTDRFIGDHDKSIVASFTVVLALSTIGLWIATIGLYRAGERELDHLKVSSERQSADMQAAVEAAREANEISQRQIAAMHRTWLKVYATDVGPISIKDGKISISIKIEAKNISNNPAVSVLLNCEPFQARGYGAAVFEQNKLIEQTKIYAAANAAAGSPGTTLLPEETTATIFSSTATISERMKKAADDQIKSGVSETNLPITLTAAYCVIYKSIGSDKWHYASHVLWIRKNDGADFELIDGNIPKNGLRATIVGEQSRFG